ncbi:MAG TPA: hypothetical protein VIC62_09160 [Nakamurella sp.]
MRPTRSAARYPDGPRRRLRDRSGAGWAACAPGWTLGQSISVTADDRTFTVAAATITACPSSTAAQTRFYQFNVTSTGHVTGLRAVGKPVTGEAVSEFAASPDGTEVAYAQQGCPAPISAVTRAGVAADTVLCQLRTAPLVTFMTWMVPAYEAAEAGPGQPCSAYATLVPSGDVANSLTASPVTGLPTARRPVTCPVLVTLNW